MDPLAPDVAAKEAPFTRIQWRAKLISAMNAVLRFASSTMSPKLILYLASFLIFGASLVGMMNSRDSTQYALVRSLADEKTIYLSTRYTGAVGEAIGRGGHIVSDREPGPSGRTPDKRLSDR